VPLKAILGDVAGSERDTQHAIKIARAISVCYHQKRGRKPKMIGGSMSTALVAAEISRFLASKEPQVLCIKGKWGVGKTFAWRKYLADAESEKASAFDRYSYVSLFGLNSLDDLRYAIVEGTVLLAQAEDGPTIETMAAFLKEKLGKGGQPIVNVMLAYIGKKDFGAALAKAAHLAIRKQIICFDDLERSGKGLDAKDVLGLASSLKEQRGCKVVLLLNDEEMAEDARKEFERQLEKVVDVSLVFDPTAPEAAAIALPNVSPVSNMLRDRIVQLGIVNIRVIKKIERLAFRLTDLLKGFTQPIIDQALSAVALGAWAILQPGEAPGLEYLRGYNRFTLGLRQRQEEGDEQAPAPAWKAKLDQYPFVYADEFDVLIFDGVKRGFFDDAAVLKAAKVLQKNLVDNPENNSFSKAWEQFHSSLTIDDEKVLGDLYVGTMENVSNINAMSLNGTIRLFRDMGRDKQADEMLAAYVKAHEGDRAFFDFRNHHFMADDEIDPALRAAFSDQYTSFVDERDPLVVLLAITNSSSWNEADVELLAKLTADEWVALFDGFNGKELPRAIEMAQRLSRHAGDRHDEFGKALRSALEMIAARSPLRTYRMRRFGISAPQRTPTAPVDEGGA
jgi:hypothetical protein